MANQRKLDEMYMRQALAASVLSHATRKKVGAMLVIENEGRFEGCNGTPSGFDNCPEEQLPHNFKDGLCEFCELKEPRGDLCQKHLRTKDICLHAEANAIMKVACSHSSTIGGTIYTTLCPCLECAKLIVQAKIARVVYGEKYPYDGHFGTERPLGVKLLEEAGIIVDYLDIAAFSGHHGCNV